MKRPELSINTQILPGFIRFSHTEIPPLVTTSLSRELSSQALVCGSTAN